MSYNDTFARKPIITPKTQYDYDYGFNKFYFYADPFNVKLKCLHLDIA